MTTAPKPSGIKLVREFFGLNMEAMKKEWMKGGLTQTDKEEIISGLVNGTLTY